MCPVLMWGTGSVLESRLGNLHSDARRAAELHPAIPTHQQRLGLDKNVKSLLVSLPPALVGSALCVYTVI